MLQKLDKILDEINEITAEATASDQHGVAANLCLIQAYLRQVCRRLRTGLGEPVTMLDDSEALGIGDA